MCGFVGLYLDNNFNLEARRLISILNNMTNILSHRGPDHKDLYINENEKLAFGFQRLSIIDLKSSANQPMISKNKDWVIIFNGEIYNYKNLKQKLKKKKNYWRSNSDSEVALECISTYGFYNAIKKLNGMFAIAAYCVSKKTLWLARDRFGEKPLYYNYDTTYGFTFASELRAFSYFPNFKKQICQNFVKCSGSAI